MRWHARLKIAFSGVFAPSSGTSSLPLAWVLLVSGVVFSVTSRLLIVYGGLPGAVNFLHYPLIIAAFIFSRQRTTGSIATLERLLALSAGLTIASIVGSVDSSFLRTILLWPILVEPILVILTIWHLAMSGFASDKALNLGLLVVLGQMPLALGQVLSAGVGDDVKGALIRQGAGHHVLGSIGLMVALVALAPIVSGRKPIVSMYGAMVAGGFLLGLITDMKQGVAVFLLVALILTFWGLRERRRSTGGPLMGRAAWLGAALGVVVLVVVMIALNTFVILLREPWRLGAPFEAKGVAVSTIADAMSDNPVSYLVGLGPGTTATRIAWLSTPLAGPSFLQGLGLESAPIARDLARQWANNPRWLQSSVSSPFSTWVGTFGDLGFLGLAALVAMWWVPWRVSGSAVDGIAARAVILFTVLLGMLFNWMEEPVLVIVAAVLVGGLSATGLKKEASRSNLPKSRVTAEIAGRDTVS